MSRATTRTAVGGRAGLQVRRAASVWRCAMTASFAVWGMVVVHPGVAHALTVSNFIPAPGEAPAPVVGPGERAVELVLGRDYSFAVQFAGQGFINAALGPEILPFSATLRLLVPVQESGARLLFAFTQLRDGIPVTSPLADAAFDVASFTGVTPRVAGDGLGADGLIRDSVGNLFLVIEPTAGSGPISFTYELTLRSPLVRQADGSFQLNQVNTAFFVRAAVPEPVGLVLLTLSLLVVGVAVRRRSERA